MEKRKRTHDDFVKIILKPLFYVTDDEIRWVLKRKESKPYKNLFRTELKKREQKSLVFA